MVFDVVAYVNCAGRLHCSECAHALGSWHTRPDNGACPVYRDSEPHCRERCDRCGVRVQGEEVR